MEGLYRVIVRTIYGFCFLISAQISGNLSKSSSDNLRPGLDVRRSP